MEHREDKPEPPVEKTAQQDIVAKKGKRRIEQDLQKRRPLAVRIAFFRHQRRILVEFQEIAIPVRVGVVQETAAHAADGQVGHHVLMDAPDPMHSHTRIKPLRVVRTMPAVIHPPAEGDVDPLDLVHGTRILRQDTGDLRLRLRLYTLVRVHIEHPVRIRLRQGKVPLRGEIARERTRNDTRSRRSRELRRAVGAVIVDHENLIGERRTLNARCNVPLLVVCENNDGKFHASASSLRNPLFC